MLLLLSVMVLLSLLLVSGIPRTMTTTTITALLSGAQRLTALQVDVHSSRILLGAVLQTQLLTELLHLGLDFLHMARRVIALADNDMKMSLAARLIRANPFLEDSFRFFDKLSVEVNAVRLVATRCVVGSEDVLGSLAIVVVHALGMGLAFVGEILSGGAIAVIVSLSGLCRRLLLVCDVLQE